MSSIQEMPIALSLDEPTVLSEEITLTLRQGVRRVVSRSVIVPMSTYIKTLMEMEQENKEEMDFPVDVDADVFDFVYEFMKMYSSDPKPFAYKELPKPVGHRHLEYIVPRKYAEYVSHTSVNGSDEDLVSEAGMAYRRKIISAIRACAYLGCDSFLELLCCKIGTTLRYYSEEEQKKRWGGFGESPAASNADSKNAAE